MKWVAAVRGALGLFIGVASSLAGLDLITYWGAALVAALAALLALTSWQMQKDLKSSHVAAYTDGLADGINVHSETTRQVATVSAHGKITITSLDEQ